MIKKIKNKFQNISFNAKEIQIHSDLLKKLFSINSQSNFNNSLIIFSKDRAMQLDLLIRSLVNYPKVEKVYVLYCATNERHKKSYEDIDKNYASINLVEEKCFYEDVKN